MADRDHDRTDYPLGARLVVGGFIALALACWLAITFWPHL